MDGHLPWLQVHVLYGGCTSKVPVWREFAQNLGRNDITRLVRPKHAFVNTLKNNYGTYKQSTSSYLQPQVQFVRRAFQSPSLPGCFIFYLSLVRTVTWKAAKAWQDTTSPSHSPIPMPRLRTHSLQVRYGAFAMQENRSMAYWRSPEGMRIYSYISANF
jgi:hypothetical protein